MEADRLLECLRSDYRLLRSAGGEALAVADPEVSTCPPWRMGDLVTHVGMVYLHKAACMRLGAKPEWPPDGLGEVDPVELLERGYGEMMAHFEAREPESETFTWYPPDPTVGFWIRRIAQESVIHRVDAQLAAGRPISPIPTDLALDGIDELLTVFVDYQVGRWPENFAQFLSDDSAASVALDTGTDRLWTVACGSTGVVISTAAQAASASSGRVSGDPATVLLWLYGRIGDDQVSVEGNLEGVANLRRLLAACTS